MFLLRRIWKIDRKEWVKAIRSARKILNQSAMNEFTGGELSTYSNTNSFQHKYS